MENVQLLMREYAQLIHRINVLINARFIGIIIILRLMEIYKIIVQQIKHAYMHIIKMVMIYIF